MLRAIRVRGKYNLSVILRKCILYTQISVFVFFAIFPIFWMISYSVRPVSDFFAEEPIWISSNFTFEGYFKVFSSVPFARYAVNSLVVSIISTMCTTLIGLFAGYAFARFRFIGRDKLSTLLLITQMFPEIVLVIPLALIMRSLKFYDTYYSLIVTYMSITIPFSVWMIKGYVQTIPRELESAAIIDGCNLIQVIFRVIYPVIRPGVAAVAVYTFLIAWGEFVFALTFLGSEEMKTLPIGIAMNFGQYTFNYELIMPMAVMYAIPAVVICAIFQKNVVKGLTAGGLKF